MIKLLAFLFSSTVFAAYSPQTVITDATTLDTADVSAAGALKTDSSAVTQPVSAASLPLPSGASTAANQSTSNSTLASILSALGSPALPTGASTSAKQDTGNSTLASILSALSSPVAVSASSLPLPSGAATSVLQSTGNASLSSIDSKLTSPLTVSGTVTANIGTSGSLALDATLSSLSAKFGTLGQKAMTGSAPVVIASDQSAIPVTVASLPLPSGASTSALQTSGNTSLSSIDGKLSSLGQKTSAASVPVVLPSDQTVSVKSPVNVTGSGSSAGATVSTVSTLTAPANAVGFVLMNLDVSTTNMRWAVGRTASTTLGQQLQPGRDTGFVPIGADISIIAESGTVTYDVQWISQ